MKGFTQGQWSAADEAGMMLEPSYPWKRVVAYSEQGFKVVFIHTGPGVRINGSISNTGYHAVELDGVITRISDEQLHKLLPKREAV